MPKPSTADLRKRRQALLRQLPPLKAILRGSLIERYKRCGKPGCKCADGPGHGPKYYLSVSYPGLRPQMDYVPQESYPQTTALLANYHRAREILEQICGMCCNYGHPNRMMPICFIWNPLFTGVSAMLYQNATGEKP